MSLALQNRGNGAPAHYVPEDRPLSAAEMSFDDVLKMAGMAAKSRMFRIESAEQAFCLMMICQSKGLHPIEAMSRYYIVNGRPTMRADAMQAEFQARGGVIEILERSKTAARALFSHPTYQPKPIEVSFTMEDARKAGLVAAGGMYEKYPDVMLWARCVTKAIRVVYPGIIAGIHSPEEAEEIAMNESPVGQIAHAKAQARQAIAEADAPVPGHDPRDPDTRPYHLVATEAVTATNELVDREWGDAPGKPKPLDARVMHGRLAAKAVATGHAEGEAPTKVQAAVAFMTKVYASDRQWVRGEIAGACDDHAAEVAETLRAVREAAGEASPDVLAAADVDAEEERQPGGDDDR